MQQASNIVDISARRRHNQQQLIDEIGAKAYMLLRTEAEQHGLDLSEVMAEHLLGLSLVMEAVEGTQTAKNTLSIIADQLGQSATS